MEQAMQNFYEQAMERFGHCGTLDHFRAFCAGFRSGTTSTAHAVTGKKLMTEASAENLRILSNTLMVSQRTLRVWHNLLLHDIRKVADIGSFINFSTAWTEQYSIGVRLGYLVFMSGYWSINSCHMLDTGHFNDLIRMFLFDLNFDMDIENIREKTADIEMPENFLPVFLFCAADHNVRDFDKDIETALNSFGTFKRPGILEPLVCTMDDADIEGYERFPFAMKISLLPPDIDGTLPTNETQKDAFLKIIRKNPGYSLPFWELIRTIAKDHGAAFIPHPHHNIHAILRRLMAGRGTDRHP